MSAFSVKLLGALFLVATVTALLVAVPLFAQEDRDDEDQEPSLDGLRVGDEVPDDYQWPALPTIPDDPRPAHLPAWLDVEQGSTPVQRRTVRDPGDTRPEAPAPSNLTASPVGQWMLISWDMVDPNEIDAVRVEYKKSDDADWLTGGTAYTVNTIVLTGLDYDTSYDIRARSYSSGASDRPYKEGFGSWSATVTASTPLPPPPAPTLNFSSCNTTTGTVRWAANSHIYQWRIDRRVFLSGGSLGPWIVAARPSASTTTYTSTIGANTTAYFRLVGIALGSAMYTGASDPSNVVTINTGASRCQPPPPPTPTPTPNRAPVFAEGESATRSVAENTGSGVNIGTRIRATDPDGDTLDYSLSGTNAASFDIVESSGQLQTKGSLNYEAKDSYSVTVTAEDPSNASDEINVTISVTNVNESGRISLTVPSRKPGTEWSAQVSDPDGAPSSILWTWQRTFGSGGWNDIPGETSSSYEITDGDLGHSIRVSARYNDGLAGRQQATSGSIDIPNRVVIAAQADVTEGDDAIFIVTSAPSPAADFSVPVLVTPSDADVLAAPLPPSNIKPVTVSSSTGTGQLVLSTALDDVDEATGTIDVQIVAGRSYFVGSDDTASVAVRDDDMPPIPTEFRINGDIEELNHPILGEVNVINLTWKMDAALSDYTSGYQAHWVLEQCVPMRPCAPVGGLAMPRWSAESRLAEVTGDEELSGKLLSGPADTPMTLYRVEIQAVNPDNETSDWSAAVLTYPTEQRLPGATSVGHVEIERFLADELYSYHICIDVNETLANQNITGTGALDTPEKVVAEIRAGSEVWDDAIGDTSLLRVRPIGPSVNQCRVPELNRSIHQVMFLENDRAFQVCNLLAMLVPGVPVPVADPACWRGFTGDIANGVASLNASTIVIRAEGYQPGRDWDTMVPGGCTQLQDTMAHEVGHVYGLGHTIRGADRPQYMMATGVPGPCVPKVYDVAAFMANYQSR